MINIIPDKYKLAIGYTWYSNLSQGICGHMFEMIEYYHTINPHIRTCMLICDQQAFDVIEDAIRDKYDFSEDEVQLMLDDIVFFDNPRMVKGDSFLLVDGHFNGMKNKVLAFNNILAFPCNDLSFQTKQNITVLQDDRIYGKGYNTIHYVKKILFDRYKTIGESIPNNLVYATETARKLYTEFYLELEDEYDGGFLLLTNHDVDVSDRFEQVRLPVKNLFERFDTYIYTPTPNHRDCSPRFIAECKFYGKDVEYFKIDYMDEDAGLCFRRYDIENDFDGICLKEDDPIIEILNGIL